MLDALCEAQQFSGVVMARRGDEIIISKAYGDANRAEGLPNTVDTRFAIASGTKTFTAVAVLQLVQAGAFALDTPLHACLDIDFPHHDPAITVHHLLCHLSGMGDYADEEEMDDADFEHLWDELPMYRVRAPRDLLPMLQDLPMKLGVGERFHYNNGAYVVLGMLIEQHSGMAYADYVTTHVLHKAGMRASGFFEVDRLPGRTALGYIDAADGTWRTNIFCLPAKGMPDGGVYVTAPDMLKFWDALRGGVLLSDTAYQQMVAPQTPLRENRAYGYGLWLITDGDEVTRHVSIGGDMGAGFFSAYFTRHDTVLTVIANKDDVAWPVYAGAIDALGLGD